MNKATEELLNELKATNDINFYLDNNEGELLHLSLGNYLEKLLDDKHVEKSTVINSSNLDRTYGYQIFSGKKRPSRDRAIALCFGFMLNIDEAQKLLAIAKVGALYARNSRDVVIIFSLNRHFNLIECNALLSNSKEEEITTFKNNATF